MTKNTTQYNLSNHISHSPIIRILLILVIIVAYGLSNSVQAQVVKQPVSEQTTTAKHYKYHDPISTTQYKDIEYMIVKASNGDIKSCFNACDVCYPNHKGYSQKGNLLQCNNCGKTFDIDALGTQGSGGCWPGHLIHAIDGDSVSFNVSDLVKGEYYFLSQTADVVDITANQTTIEISNNSVISVKSQDVCPSYLKIFSTDGRICKNVSNLSSESQIDISDLSSGTYFIIFELQGKSISKSFYILR